MTLATRVKKLEAVADPPPREPLIVSIRLFNDNLPLPDPIHSTTVDGHPFTVQYRRAGEAGA